MDHNEEKDNRKFWIALLLTPIVSIGMAAASSYLTAQEMMARFDERLSTVESHVSVASDERKDLEEETSEASERLVRVETKIDILLMKASND